MEKGKPINHVIKSFKLPDDKIIIVDSNSELSHIDQLVLRSLNSIMKEKENEKSGSKRR